ncbi:hypothetical protein LX16_0042 [Stackebrandtia albiflava]|uniref:Uncharacterized protein n=1 Tax=Stackebrandtia albiflava TaxID=406432 RepID=A0A562VGU3_9ACTN|nr:hypothetical protein [Stackebrandtia albiflava]TWJ17126.1 hypothetical protein LX16_0042 [Stackebrandtia albiflava]
MTVDSGDVSVLLVRGTERRLATLRVVGRDPYRLRLEGMGQLKESTGPDLFEALVALRRDLETDGWLPAVQGARRDAYPSGMARDMGGGERIHLLHTGRPASTADLVDTLAPVADVGLLATVAQQHEAYVAWLESLARKESEEKSQACRSRRFPFDV